MPDCPCEFAFQLSDEPWFEVEADMGDVLEVLECVGNAGNFGSSKIEAWVSLETRADYDLMLVAREIGGPPEKGVARNHFRTSRHQNAEALIRGLGLDGEFVNSLPDDALMTGPMPASIGSTDAALDHALEDMGIGPVPLPPEGRTTLLWREASPGDWRLQGVLFESDEPIHRDQPMIGFVDEQPKTRLAITGITVPSTGLVFQERTRNAAGTRILWAVKVPTSLGKGRYTLQVTFANRSSNVVAQAPLFDRPLVVTQEAE